jgi:uncharacterized caspase-like protein
LAEYALIIGINRYEDAVNIPTLKWAEEDASGLNSVLINPLYCGIPEQNITYLLGEDATRDNIIRGIGELRARAGRGDTVFIFFSGHGCSERNEESTQKSPFWRFFLVKNLTKLISRVYFH